EQRKKRISKNEVLLEAVKGSLAAMHPVNANTTGYGSKRDTIREAINRIQKSRFVQDEVEDQIRRINPKMEINRNRIRAALWSMSHKGDEIKLARRGSNQQPAEYEK